MDCRSCEFRDCVAKLVFCLVGDVVALLDGQLAGDIDVDFGAESVTDPSQADGPHLLDLWHGVQGSSCLLDEGRVYCVHESSPDVADDPAQDHEDGGGDE